MTASSPSDLANPKTAGSRRREQCSKETLVPAQIRCEDRHRLASRPVGQLCEDMNEFRQKFSKVFRKAAPQLTFDWANN